ncbi:MAG: sigma-70 family RNA polymerase sigma factor [Ruminococcus sp.]|nr:sigma-70 family RNA polymerase sigma factor [Ruminococcus sp.]
MEKQRADKLILHYQNKIFGFALKKMRNISQAEELASNIVCEVYQSFLNTENIANIDGYVYRIASNVYAKYIHTLTVGRNLENINEITLPFYDDGFDKPENEETLSELRREIGYLSQRQRTVVYMHYYEKKSAKEIADKLGISTGTVKWHLSDARSTLKEELAMKKYNDDLAVNPIKFSAMGHNGYPGIKGDTNDMFDTQLKQNIAFACYYKPLNAKEIARKLNVPVTYVADELKILCEYGYIDQVDNSKNPKYLTNMFITDSRLFDNTESVMLKQAAKFMCDNFYQKVFNDFDRSQDNWGFSCDGNDKNFMKYTLVMLCTDFSYSKYDDDNYWSIYEKLKVKRPDGGCFIAHASISNDYKQPDENPYWACGYMTRATDKNSSIQVDCRFSGRSDLAWRDNLDSDWDSLYAFIKGGCNPQAITLEEYKRLCDKGYIHDDKVQVMSCKNTIGNPASGINILKNIIHENVSVSNEVKSYVNDFDKRQYEYEKDKYPPHIRPIVQHYSTNTLSAGHFIPYLIEEMLDRDMLKPLTELQKKSVFSVMTYAD